jgi:pimeloyl-ACP methyl ester carboxylesterase
MMVTVVDDLPFPTVDPRDSLSKLAIPGLWYFGGRDNSIPVDLSIERLQNLVAGGHTVFEYRVFPGYDHELGGIDLDVIAPAVEWIRSVSARGR